MGTVISMGMGGRELDTETRRHGDTAWVHGGLGTREKKLEHGTRNSEPEARQRRA